MSLQTSVIKYLFYSRFCHDPSLLLTHDKFSLASLVNYNTYTFLKYLNFDNESWLTHFQDISTQLISFIFFHHLYINHIISSLWWTEINHIISSLWWTEFFHFVTMNWLQYLFVVANRVFAFCYYERYLIGYIISLL